MAKVIKYTPELEGDEQLYVAQLMKDMTEEQAEHFANVYRERRKDPELILFTDLAGFLGFAGIHRFVLGQVFLGLVYLFTLGFCGIGTIVDMFMFKQITQRFNKQKADEVAYLITHVIDAPAEDD
ncbi:MAG: TM2 domain-containing protein [Bacteroidota bacterium]